MFPPEVSLRTYGAALVLILLSLVLSGCPDDREELAATITPLVLLEAHRLEEVRRLCPGARCAAARRSLTSTRWIRESAQDAVLVGSDRRVDAALRYAREVLSGR